MLSPDLSEKALRKFFRKNGVGQLADLFEVLQTGSRMSVFRRLSALGYCSSFTHAGSYYTLAEVPEFDSWGLWFHRQVGFSRIGTLKDTIVELVNNSPTGMTPQELRALLKLPVSNALYNTVSELVRAARLQSRKGALGTVYTSAVPQLAEEQIERRQVQQRAESTPTLPAAAEIIIDVLVEALMVGEVLVEAPVISARLQARSINVSAGQVQQVLSHYGLQPGKKTGSSGSRLCAQLPTPP